VPELGGDGSVLARQRRDHEDLDRLLDEALGSSGERQREVINRTWRLVFSHAFAEEAVLWPAARKVLPDGGALTLRVEQEHQEINQLVSRLEALAPDDPEFQPLFRRIADLLRTDVRDEEDLVLPRLQDALDERSLRHLGRSWSMVRRVAPTRPHPVVSRRPPGNVLSALPLSMIDRSRDVLDHQARGRPGAVGRWSGSWSRALARAARSLEHLHVLRRGEDPSTAHSESADS
jgi:hemerythrin superfamily protein